MNKRVSYKIVSLIFAILVICFAIAFYAFSWTGPTADPPGDNVDPPINTGGTGQYKLGALAIGGPFLAYSDAIIDGNVGIGTTAPGAKLDVAGTRSNTAGNVFMKIQNVSAAGFRLDTNNAFNLDLYNGATWTNPITVLQNNGNVGIGTTSPSQKLDVDGYVKGRTGLCIGNDCRTTWPAGGVDTRCDTSGTCSQVCIGSDCRSSWAPSVCTWNSKTYTTGAVCNTTSSCYTSSIYGSNTIAECLSNGTWRLRGWGYPCPMRCGT